MLTTTTKYRVMERLDHQGTTHMVRSGHDRKCLQSAISAAERKRGYVVDLSTGATVYTCASLIAPETRPDNVTVTVALARASRQALRDLFVSPSQQVASKVTQKPARRVPAGTFSWVNP